MKQAGHKQKAEESPVDPVIPVDMERELRCSYRDCGRLLGKGYIAPGSALQIKCPKCKNYPRFGSI